MQISDLLWAASDRFVGLETESDSSGSAGGPGRNHANASICHSPSKRPNRTRREDQRVVSVASPPRIVVVRPTLKKADRLSWSIYITDRCGSISAQWPPAIADSDITTPFPKPLYEYEVVRRSGSSSPIDWEQQQKAHLFSY